MKLNISLNNITDPQIRDTFASIKSTVETDTILKGTWKLYDISLASASTVRYQHRLGFIPTDVIVTSVRGASVTFDYDSFDKEIIVFTSTGKTRIRFFAGKAE